MNAVETKRLSRAIEIASGLDLSYMADSGEYTEEDNSFVCDIERFMIFEQTDGCDDGWVTFVESVEDAEYHIADACGGEWGVAAVYDLDAVQYKEPVTIEFDLAGPSIKPEYHGHYRGVKRGRNAHKLLGFGPEQDAAIACSVLLDDDAELIKEPV